jgi:GT2 family glycosyltransferase
VTTDLPSIAFVVATLNEAKGIEACVRSLQTQRYPAELLRIAVVDGGSTDETVALVETMAAADERVLVLRNPKRIAPSAFNIGIGATDTDVISLVSAHSTLDPDYAAVLADAFTTSGASLVGGRMEAIAPPDDPVAQAIVRATSSPLGLGSATFHYADEPGWVDTAFPGAYRRELLAEIGGFDESLVRNQDDELHLRAAIAGHRMWFDPRLRSAYRPRSSRKALWKQYFEYGWWRTVTLRKHKRVASPRHLVPAVLVAGLASGPVLFAVRALRPLRPFWVLGATAWGALLVAAGVRERDAGPAVAGRVPSAIACLHLAYGSGFWSGALHQLRAAAREERHG